MQVGRGLLKLFSVIPASMQMGDPDMIGDSKGPPSKRARPDTPLETPITDSTGKFAYKTKQHEYGIEYIIYPM